MVPKREVHLQRPCIRYNKRSKRKALRTSHSFGKTTQVSRPFAHRKFFLLDSYTLLDSYNVNLYSFEPIVWCTTFLINILSHFIPLASSLLADINCFDKVKLRLIDPQIPPNTAGTIQIPCFPTERKKSLIHNFKKQFQRLDFKLMKTFK